jgi:hypothetical protein
VQFKVYPMRKKGRRISLRDVKNGPSYVGDLRSHVLRLGDENYNVITLFSGNKAVAEHILPDLFEPVLVGFSTLAFQVRGYERIAGKDGYHAVIQEWHCVESEN